MVISMLAIGSASVLSFIIIEWRFTHMPMVPLHLFRNPAICAIIIQQFLLGIVHYSQIYILPIYYQNVRQYSTLKAATVMIPYVVSQSVTSILSGHYISYTKRFGEVIWLGYFLWLVGVALLVLFNRTIQSYAMVLVLICEGAGVGLVFQPTLIAAQAHSSKADRAVVISVRSFIRALGGAVGLAFSPAIFSNVLYSSTAAFPTNLRRHIKELNLGLPDWHSYSNEDADRIMSAYAAAARMTFIAWVPFMAICFVLCFFIKDKGLKRKEESTSDQPQVLSESTQNATEKRAGDVSVKA